MTNEERKALRALADSATLGPWVARKGAGWIVTRPDAEARREAAIGVGMTPATTLVGDPLAPWWRDGEAEANARLMAASRAAVPALLDALEAAEREMQANGQQADMMTSAWQTVTAERDAALAHARAMREALEEVARKYPRPGGAGQIARDALRPRAALSAAPPLPEPPAAQAGEPGA